MRRQRKPALRVVRSRAHDQLKWKLAGYYVNGKRVRRFFETKEDADTFIRQVRTKQENLGTRAAHIDPRLHVMAIECADRLSAHGKTLADATEFYCQHLESIRKSGTVADVIAEFLEAKEIDKHKKRYLEELRYRLGHFQKDFGKQNMATVSTRDCHLWLQSLRAAPRSRNNYRRVLSVLFNYALLLGYCAENPISKVPKSRVTDQPIGLLTPDQMRALLEKAPSDIRSALAIGAFAGLRTAEIERLDWKDVHLDRDFIEVSAAKSKTASRRLVTILPNLKAWLEKAPNRRGKIAPINARVKREAAQKRAGITEWPPNALRHSYASYHLAKFQDSAALALQMGHSTTAMIFAHYREVVTPAEAEKYWAIIPSKNIDAFINLESVEDLAYSRFDLNPPD